MKNQEKFKIAIKNNNIEKISYLLNVKDFDPTLENNYGLRYATHFNHIEIVKMLVNDNRVYPFDYAHYVKQLEFQKEMEDNNINKVKSILNDKNINPSYNDNQAIIYSCENGNLEMVKLLLKDERVNPAMKNNKPIGYSSQFGHIEIVKLLLNDTRVDPSDYNNYALQYAKQHAHLNIVHLLWKDKRIKESLVIDNNDLYNELKKQDIENKVTEF